MSIDWRSLLAIICVCLTISPMAYLLGKDCKSNLIMLLAIVLMIFGFCNAVVLYFHILGFM